MNDLNKLIKTFTKKKVLIIGNTGFKGSWLTIAMMKLGADVYGISNNIPTNPSFFKTAKLFNYIKFFKVDIRNRKKLKSTINQIKPDFIFHLAAQSLVFESINSPENTFETNIIGTVNILNILKDIKYKCIAVIITSDKCYLNLEKKIAYRENDPLGGKDPYSASKSSAEIIFKCYIETYYKNKINLKIASARAGNVIGGGDWANNRLVPDLMKSFYKNNDFKVRNPSSTRPWQHVLEPISGYIFLAYNLSLDKKGVNHNSFNFAPYNFNNISVKDLINKIKLKMKINPVYVDDSRSTFESKLLQLNSSKSKKILNWRSILSLNETIDYTISWYLKYFNHEDILQFSNYQIDSYFKKAISKKLWKINT